MSFIAPSSQSKLRSLLPRWLKVRWEIVGILALLYTFVDISWTYFHWGGTERVTLISDLFSLPPGLLAVSLAWHVAARPMFPLRLRRAWFLLGLGFLMFFIGNIIWFYLEVVLSVEPFPSIADIFYLAFYPFVLLGILTLPDISLNRRDYLTLSLDLFSVMTAATMLVGYFIIIPTAIANNSDTLTEILSCAYPFSSLILMGGLLATLYRRPSANTQRLLLFLLSGMMVFVGSDFTFAYISVAGTYTVGGWPEVGWNVAQLLFGLAALREIYHGPNSASTEGLSTLQSRFTGWLPPIAVALGYGLVAYVVIVNHGWAAEWLMAGALLLTLLIITRQIVSPAFADLPIRVKMILTFILVSVLSVILVFVMAYLTIRSNLEAVVGEKLKADVEFRAQTLGNELSKQIDLLEGFVLGETIEYGVAESNAYYTEPQAATEVQLQEQAVLTNAIARELDDFRYNFPDHNDLLLTDQHGRTIAVTTRPDRYSQVSEEWWQSAYNQGKGAIYIGQPKVDPDTQDLQVIIAIPVQADHTEEVIGVLCTTYRIQNTLEMLTPLHLETHIGFNLLLPDGQLLHPQGSTQSLEPDVIARLRSSKEADYTSISFEGKLQLMSQAPVVSSDATDSEAFKALDWTLIDHEESAAAFAPLFAASKTTLLTLLFVLCLTTGVAAILAQILIAPISRLTLVARQIVKGDLSAKAQIESGDEIGILANTFNSMLEALSRTQKELQESVALYRSLVDYSPDTIVVLNEDKILFINPAGVELVGANNADELIGQPILNIILPQELEPTREGIAQLRASTLPTPLLEQTVHRPDGTSFESEFRAIPITYAGESAIQVVMRDITERKRLEEQWQKFKLGIEHSTEAVFMTDVDGTIRYVNPAFERLYGYFWDEAVGQTPRILKSGEISQEVYEHFWQTLLAKGSTTGELVNRTRDGRLINIEGSATPILDHDGSLVGFLAVQRDVTERKNAQEKIHQLLAQVARQRDDLEIRVAERTEELNSLNQLLRSELIERQRLVQSLSDSESRFRLLFESSPDAILLIDPSDPDNCWPIVDCNEVACRMNGYTRQELIGQSIDLLNEAPGDPAERTEYLEYLRGEGVLRRDGIHRHKDGHVFPIEVSSSLIRFGNRELVLGIDRDITERKQAELALQEAKEVAESSQGAAEAASRAKSEFLSRMSHELRTPMNAILGFAQLLEMSQKEPLTSSQQERVRQIVKGGQHLLDLINEILDISRIEANRLHISPEPVSVRESVQEVLDLTVPLAIQRHIQVVTRPGGMEANPFVKADRQRFKQVLLNLLGNAVKYNYDGGSVIITCQPTAVNRIRISIADTGPGIPPEQLGRLFKPFERLVSDQSNIEGTGLGLTLAKRLVELMHGQIGVDSTPGRGSTFWIELPAAENPVKGLQSARGTRELSVMSTVAHKILYVEDNVANFELIREVLADYSQIELLWASDARAGFEMALQHQPSLVLLDVHLGGSDGAELLQNLKRNETLASIPVVVVSADATSGQAHRLTSLGAHTFMTKPLDVKRFVQLLEELLGQEDLNHA